MAAASSSSGAGAAFAVYLYDNNFNRVALVDVPVPLPNLVTYLGNPYVWSAIHWAYFPAVPYTAQGDLGAPQLSVLANPQQ